MTGNPSLIPAREGLPTTRGMTGRKAHHRVQRSSSPRASTCRRVRIEPFAERSNYYELVFIVFLDFVTARLIISSA